MYLLRDLRAWLWCEHMHTKTRRMRGVPAPEELRQRLAVLLDSLGPGPLAVKLGLARHTLLGVCAGARSMPGTAALIRERLPAIESGSAETSPSL